MGDSVKSCDAKFDLRDPASAYVFGFMQADGHHYAGKGQKGSITIEIKAQDADLLRAMQQVLPWRTSVTFRTEEGNELRRVVRAGHAHPVRSGSARTRTP